MPDPRKIAASGRHALLRLPACLAMVMALGWGLRAAPAWSEPRGVSAGRFESWFEATVAATPAEVFKVMAEPARWWSPKHTWSGDAANLHLDAVAGGCWCEVWGDGNSVQHARVLKVLPGRMLLLQGGLGPLQELPVVGVLKLETRLEGGQTRLHMSYQVAGPTELALDQWAPVVDGVIGEQFTRLRASVDASAGR
jgi:uncharacterized protein YndB with AHSA1/START domain